jgi:phage gpG-like protein
MAVAVRVRVKGTARLAAALANVNPKKNPRILAAFFGEAGRLLEQRIRTRLDGPRPRELDQVTGELYASVTSDRSETALEVGTPLPWAEFHELGLGRFQNRAFVLPALEESLGELEALLARTWESQAGAALPR